MEIAAESRIKITIDDREKNNKLLHLLTQTYNADVCIKRLVTGDYLLEGLLIERKTVSDFCTSLTTGRLFRQMARLSNVPQQPALIIEGTANDWEKIAITRDAIQGALITISILFKIAILRSQSPEETAKVIMFSAKQLNRSLFLNKAYPRVHTGNNQTSKKHTIQSNVLQGFPGIGPKRAKELLNHFENLTAIFTATPAQLAKVAGLGKRTMKKLREWMD